jgi:hypothetical protein
LEAQWDRKGHIASGAETRHCKFVDIKAQLFGVLREIQDSFHAIFHCYWKRMLGCEAIVDAYDNGTDLRYDSSGPACIVAGIAQSETATVEVDNDGIFMVGSALAPRQRAIEVQ